MSDAQVVLMAVAALLGALHPVAVPIVLPIIACTLAYVLRRPLLLVAAVALLCATLAHRSWEGIDALRAGTVDSTGALVTDPERVGGTTSVVLRVDGTRYLGSAWGPAGARLARASAGDRVVVKGTAKLYQGSRERRAALHVGYRLSIQTIEVSPATAPLWRVANGVRGHIVGGAQSLSPERRALFTGLVYGDDRGQNALTASDFRLAGLTHLLAVSGQNVAYVLTMARPVIERFSLRGRWIATVGLLVVFATVTRFEPSVLRATVMAGLAVTSRVVGREAAAGRLLALAVTGLLVIDPLLASTVAFRLSAAASAGIIWLQPFVRPHRLRPAWLADVAGVTIAAQLAVAPVLVTTFGPVSLVSLPANVLAGPVAGLTMAWGMSGGLLAGLLPPALAGWLHQVTTALLWTLEAVARAASRVPLAPVGLSWLLGAVILTALWSSAGAARSLRLPAAALALALLIPLAPRPVPGRHDVGRSSEVVIGRDGVVLVLRDGERLGWLLDDLRALQVRRIDLAQVADSPSGATMLPELSERIEILAARSVTAN